VPARSATSRVRLNRAVPCSGEQHWHQLADQAAVGGPARSAEFCGERELTAEDGRREPRVLPKLVLAGLLNTHVG
jgi:hypothetical protein